MSGAQRRKIRKLSDGPDGDGDDMIEEAAGAALQALLQAQVRRGWAWDNEGL